MTQAAVNNAIVLHRLSVSREDVRRADDGKHKETSMENWKKAAIGIDVVIVLFMAGMEVLVIRGYKKRKNAE